MNQIMMNKSSRTSYIPINSTCVFLKDFYIDIFIYSEFLKYILWVHILSHSNVIIYSRWKDLSSILFSDYRVEFHLIRSTNDETYIFEWFFYFFLLEEKWWWLLHVVEQTMTMINELTFLFFFSTMNIIMFPSFCFLLSKWITRQVYTTCLMFFPFCFQQC
jgi:hypothetical protein